MAFSSNLNLFHILRIAFSALMLYRHHIAHRAFQMSCEAAHKGKNLQSGRAGTYKRAYLEGAGDVAAHN